MILVQVELGKVSLNLGRADTAIYFSNSPSYDARRQSEDRIVLVEKTGALLYVDMLVKNTVSEDVRELLRDKRWRSDASIRRAVRARMEARHGT